MPTVDTSHRQKLIMDHYPMVRRIAHRLVARYPASVDVDDLITIGMLGLIEAVDRFDGKRQLNFTAYARIRVQGAIVDELRRQDWVPRSVRSRAGQIAKVTRTLEENLCRPPTGREIACAMGVEVEELHRILKDVAILTLISVEENDEDEQGILDQVASDTGDPMDVAAQQCLRARILRGVGRLSERERQLVELYYFRSRSIKEISELFGVSESRVSQLHSRAKDRLGPILRSLLEVYEIA